MNQTLQTVILKGYLKLLRAADFDTLYEERKRSLIKIIKKCLQFKRRLKAKQEKALRILINDLYKLDQL